MTSIRGGALARKLKQRYVEPLPLKDFGTYDEYWASRVAGAEPPERPRWKLAVAKIPDGASVLDVGCGPGAFLAYLTARRPNVTATGTDVSDAAVQIARAQGLNAFTSDPANEPIGGEYDYVTCFEMIEHVHEAERVLVSMRDVMRKQLIMSLPNIGYLEHRIRLGLFGRFPNTHLQYHAKEHIRHWTVRDFVDWAEHFGLRVVDVQGQWGPRGTPWRRYPRLFSPQVVYTLEHAAATSR
jgi:methionine biosynthesis protein MetW